jgi:hypothetical protein
MRLSALALMIKVDAAQANAAPIISTSPSVCRGSSAGVGTPKATSMPAKESANPSHCGAWNRSAGRNTRVPSTTMNGAR